MNCKNSSNSAGAGNTKPPLIKQISPSKRWCFTVFNTAEDNIKNIIDICNSSNNKYIIGYEHCADGKKHLQCYIEFYIKCRPKNLFLDQTIHWEKAKGNKLQNINYCSKEKIHSTNFKLPKPVIIIKDDQLYYWEKQILNIIKDEPDDRHIWWFMGSGGCGKTSFCKYLIIKYQAIILGGKHTDMKNAIVDFFKTNNYLPELIVINIPKSFNKDYLSYTGIEEIKDMCFYSGKYEGGMICGNCPHVIIFSNEWPDIAKISKDRWKLFNIDKNEFQVLY